MVKNTDHLLMCLLATFISSFTEYILKFFAHFLDQVMCWLASETLHLGLVSPLDPGRWAPSCGRCPVCVPGVCARCLALHWDLTSFPVQIALGDLRPVLNWKIFRFFIFLRAKFWLRCLWRCTVTVEWGWGCWMGLLRQRGNLAHMFQSLGICLVCHLQLKVFKGIDGTIFSSPLTLS